MLQTYVSVRDKVGEEVSFVGPTSAGERNKLSNIYIPYLKKNSV